MNLNLCAVPTCTDDPFIQQPLHLCRQHALMVSLSVTDVLHANALAAATSADLDIDRVAVASDSVWSEASHQPVVYFMVNGDRVKIGVSTNITARAGALCLRKENTALLLQGSYDLEGALHAHFEADRIGQTEWFVLSPRIQDYIARRKQADAVLRQPQISPARTSEADSSTAGTDLLPKPPSAEAKILDVLAYVSSPIGSVYLHKDQIGVRAGVHGSTLDNALSRLSRTGRIQRNPVVRGEYSLGPSWQPSADAEAPGE
ncbi:GIY-YIG nuclease family protein [Streptomyces angustmyceticus]|uniref:GIY-YIG nuclease family protein n=1 Tax=Streptomyces angustmyceticus TaxID=285578 RepID=UPI00344D1090